MCFVSTRLGAAVAALPLLLGTGPSKAQTTSPSPAPVLQLERVTVTANRFEALLDELPAGVTLITGEQIRQSGASTANEAIWRIGGVSNRLSTGVGSDRTLDLRGFGATADSNTVYLVDGVRLNEGDSSAPSLSWLPVGAIDRIEITRGNGAVLYGEGATGGVIHIITRKGAARSGGSATARTGSWGTGELSGETHLVNGPWQVQVAGSSLDTQQHRDNYALREHNASLNAQWAQDGTRLALKLASQSQAGGTPGGLKPEQAEATPSLALQPRNRGRNATDLMGLSLQFEAGDGWTVASDVSLRHKEINYISAPSFAPYVMEARALQWGARGQRSWSDATTSHTLTLGTDIERWTQDRSYGDAISQDNKAVYLQNEMTLRNTGTQLLAGVRRLTTDRHVASFLTSQLQGGFNIWELGITQVLNPGWKAHARWGRSVRLANADEYTCTDAKLCSAVTVNLLDPQSSHDAELGLRFARQGEQSQLRYYRHALKSEIGYDLSVGEYGANVNFAPTLREGLELEHRHTLSSTLSMTGQVAVRRAVFRSGVYAGNHIPQTAQRTAALRLRYSPDSRHHLEVGGQWTSSQRVSDDFDNQCRARIAGGGVMDARYAMDWERWTFALTVNNLADRHYASLRTRCDAGEASVFPEPGRSVMLSARVNF